MRILVIDDEKDSRDMVTAFLEVEGFDVSVAATSEDGLTLVQKKHPDLVVLDVRLPRLSGRDVCQRIRAFSDVPILMISAYERGNDDIVHGLNVGADDYLPKPLNLDLFKARIMALLRRSTRGSWRDERPVYVDSYLIVDLRNEQVQVDGQTISLSPMEFRLLALLVANSKQVIPSIEIVETLWPHGDIDEYMGYVHTYVKRVRKIIEPDPSTPRYILTEHGLGYRFLPQT